MGLTAPLRLRVEDPSGAGAVRRAAARAASGVGFDEEAAGRAALVATELATNLVRHAGGGDVVLRPTAAAAGAPGTLEILAWDRGPGIGDLERSMRDGFSTAGGSGTGLGGVGRMADDLEIYAPAAGGTVIAARLGPATSDPRVGGLALAVAPETVSGDAWGAVTGADDVTVLLADGLGHGPQAGEASEAAVAQLRGGEAPEATMNRVHDALRPTRGAAVAIARLDLAARTLDFAGVGNIAAAIVGVGERRALTSMNGTVGRQIRSVRSYRYELPDHGLLVLHSDGCRGGWDLAGEPALRRRAPLLTAGLLVRDFERGRDDVGVVVVRLGRDGR